ncbi:MAG: class I SAM-dependent methyltransferase [Terriglobales bacterium]
MNPPPNLNPLARLYRWMEWFTFGPALDRCRRAFLPDLLASRRALALGDGDGRFTARLLRANPRVHIDAVDASSAMLGLLVRHAGPHAARVRAHCTDARLWQPSGPPYDLIFAHFFLDFLTPGEVRGLARRLRPAVSPSALWVVSEFVIPETFFGRLVARQVVAALYRAFGLLTGLKVRRLPNHPRALACSGFTLLSRRTFLCGLLSSELWQPAPVDSTIDSL